jgi:hypothetical integral membrane protein (TIGR02206 family)
VRDVTSFDSFTLVHLAAVGGVAAAITLIVVAGRRWRGNPWRQRQLERGLAGAIILLRAGVFVWNLAPSRLSLARSLPLQICDLAALCSAFALLTPSRRLASVAYFWGLALSIQGLLQPDLSAGPASQEFWLFWVHHALIVGTALYLVLVRRFRPEWRDLRWAVSAAVAYAILIFLFDLLLDVNYGYFGKGMPSQPTLLNWLGPWPWRVLVMIALGVVVMCILFVPWLRKHRVDSPEMTIASNRPTARGAGGPAV